MLGLVLAAVFQATTLGAPNVTTAAPCANGTAPGVTLQWTAPATGTATARVTSSAFDTQVAIRFGASQLAYNDDGPGGSSAGSLVTWQAVAGEVYSVVVTGFAGDHETGPYTLTITEPSGPVEPGDPCATHPVMFTVTGPPCTAARAALPCTCAEPIVWDATQGAESWDVFRDGLYVGNTAPHDSLRVTGTDADGEPIYVRVPVPRWLPEWDSTVPEFGRVYTYQARACSAKWTPNCGALSATSVRYSPPPVGCYDTKERPCYPGDALATVSP